jgi:probable F420-dependent oxidoreductase
MQALTGGRFQLGIARSSPQQWANLGLPAPTNAALADHAALLRRLWSGETIDHSGPAGRFPHLRLGERDPNPPPLMLAAIGPKTIELAGRHFDGVVLHPFLTLQAVSRSAEIARRAAKDAGRDPQQFRVIATVVVAPDFTVAERLLTVEARAVTYFSIPDVGGAILRVNEWDPTPVQRLLADPNLAGLEFQRVPHAEFMARISKAAPLIPGTWATEGAAVGDARQCAARLRAYRDAGADELLLHGATAERLQAVLQHYSEIKSRFE